MKKKQENRIYRPYPPQKPQEIIREEYDKEEKVVDNYGCVDFLDGNLYIEIDSVHYEPPRATLSYYRVREVENPNYEKQLEKYKKDLKKYEKDLALWNAQNEKDKKKAEKEMKKARKAQYEELKKEFEKTENPTEINTLGKP